MNEMINNDDLLKDIDEQVRVLVLVTGTLESGESQWAYASIPLTKYDAFKAAEAKGHYDLGEFGRIMEHGEGSEPPADIIQKMKDEHGADHKFEDELDAMMAEVDALIDKELK